MSALSDRPRTSSTSTSPTTSGFNHISPPAFDLPDHGLGQQFDNSASDLASGVGHSTSIVPITPSSAARRNRPIEVDPLDTTRRVNYRPTALPMDHQRNVDDDAGGARWLSEDEGGDTVRRASRSGSFGAVSGRRPRGNDIAAGPPRGSGLGLGFGPGEGGENANRLERDAWGVSDSRGLQGGASTSGSGPVTEEQTPRSGLEQAKAHWKSVGSSRGRLRRTVSGGIATSPTSTTGQGVATETSASQGIPIQGQQHAVISGHPVAPSSGIPMPALRTLAPPPRASVGGVSTYQASEVPAAVESTTTAVASSSKPPSPKRHAIVVEHVDSGLSRHSSDAAAALALSSLGMGDLPDFAAGRGGDGFGGSGASSSSKTAIEHVEESLRLKEAERRKRKQIVAKLSDILKCPCCPPDSKDQTPFLNHPVTLYCGHTFSSSHVRVPHVPQPDTTGYSPADAFGILEAYNARRLMLWSKIPCPLPTCSRHVGRYRHAAQYQGDDEQHSRHNIEHPVCNAQGVTYYPPGSGVQLEETDAGIVRCPPPSDLSGLSTDKSLMDVTVAKVLALVWKQMTDDTLEDRRLESFRPSLSRSASSETVATETDGQEADDEEDEVAQAGSSKRTRHEELAHATSFKDGSVATRSPAKLTRTSSKRQRQSTSSEQYPSPPHKRATHLPSSSDSALGQDRPSIGRRKGSMSFEKELCAVLECDVCAQILHKPVTTPCQHTFCSSCLARSLDHSAKCPLCRQDLPSVNFFQDHTVNKVLTDIVMNAFPEEYAERLRAVDSEGRDAQLDTPIFVCTLAFPDMPTILHVFEPRYRLMLRRCIESGTPRFGMVLPARGAGNGGIAGVLEYGTMLDIRSIQMLPDGRSMVETMGSYRFRLLEKGSLDGYTVGRVERIEDIAVEDEVALEQMSIARARARANNTNTSAGSSVEPAGSTSSSRPGLPRSNTSVGRPGSSGPGMANLGRAPINEAHEPSTVELMGVCTDFIDQLRSGSAPWLLQRLNSTYGPMPEDASTFSYWMALVMPIDEYEKARLLPIRSPRLRLKLIVHWVEQLRSSWWWVFRYMRPRTTSSDSASPPP